MKLSLNAIPFYNKATPTVLTLITAAFLLLTSNHVFFEKLLVIYPLAENMGFILSVGLLLFFILVLFIAVLSLLLPVRWVCSLFLLTAAVAGFYMDRFGITFDDVMLQNIVETDVSEAADLFSYGLILYVLVLGVFPVIGLWLLKFTPSLWWRELRYGLQTALVSIFAMVLCIVSFSDVYAVFSHEHKNLRYYSNPSYAIYSLGKFIASYSKTVTVTEIKTTSPNADIADTDTGHELIIMVVGETARRDRFSLNGYARNTNPELSKESRLVSYSHISACGTSTAVSVPCMFSMLDRDDYSRSAASGMENVLDVLARVGVNVLWRDNNSGSKGVADRIPFEDFSDKARNPVCDVECRDVGMLQGLQEYIDAQNGDILIVLHQMGNHGPAYYKRYPAEFERFTPACHSAELGQCSDEEINNAYDNAILYTDYFLAKAIALLKANTPNYETALLYVSDHGESLGENGLYLHGMPYLIAPAEQIEVPVIAWVGESSDVDISSALELKDVSNSHDAVCHALLDLFEVDSASVSNGPSLFQVN
ncbi:phosphoethanolamine--lipid A transferase [Dasania marina]|uniref:phosphoethanolamine transferase n=1 Tax=Dasania marina TaxID=471499 RepID=UPI0030D84492|tara:strand:+ start:6945 stop:8555 length:1611 start_codon:yes stop_codon:yes gene_type:complete